MKRSETLEIAENIQNLTKEYALVEGINSF